MEQYAAGNGHAAAARLFSGPGDVRAHCRAHDWPATPLGPVDGWPQSLRTAVDLCLGAAIPSFVYWGPEFVGFYNDAALPIVRAQHPAALGVPARQAWESVWDYMGDLLRRVVAGEAVRADDVPFALERGGPKETSWFTFSYAPVRDDAGEFAGVYVSALETTDRVRAEAALRAGGEWQAYLLLLSDALHDIHDPVRVQEAAARVLGEALRVDHACYVEVDEARAELVVAREWQRDGVPSHARRHPLDEWPSWLANRRPWVVCDVDTDPAMPDAQRGACRGNGIGACVVVPLFRGGRLMATLSVDQRAPRAWTTTEVAMVEGTALRTWAALESAHAEAARREGEARYRMLFTEMDQAYAVVEVIADDAGAWVDFRFLEVNPAFLMHTAMPDPVGRTATELLGSPNPRWAEIYGRVAETGESVRFEEREMALGRVFDLNVVRMGAQGSHRVAVLFSDITARKSAEAAAAQQADLDAYRVALADALRGAAGPVDAQAVATRLLGDHLGTGRVMYGEADAGSADSFTNFREYRPDTAMPTSLGRYRWADFGAYAEAEMRAGRTIVADDVRTHPGHASDDLAAYESVGVRAYVAVSLVREGRIVAFLAVNQATPRAWSPTEIAIAEETAERTWAAVERARAEAALRASEARMGAVIESLPVAVGVVDASGALLVSNAAMQHFMPDGLIPSRDAARVARWDAVDAEGHPVDPEDFPGARALRGERVASGLEMRYRQDDGREAWTRVSAVPIQDADGRVSGAAVVITDIDTLVRYAESLEASEERHRHIVDGARDYAIITTDPDGRIVTWSPGAEAVLGWTAAQIEGEAIALTFVPEDRARGVPEQEMGQAATQGFALDVRWHQRKDGSRVFIEGITRALHRPDGALRGYLKIGQDLTRRRELDEAVRAGEARYRTLRENVLDYAIFLLDANGIVTEWTPGAERVKGYTSDEVVGRHVSMFYTPEGVAAGEPERELAEAASTGRAERESWRVRKGGERFWMNEIMTAVHDAEGRLTGFTKISRDLTERHAALEAVERVRAATERDAFRRQLAAAEEAERRRIARELHDQLGQHLTGFALGLTETRRLIASGQSAEPRIAKLEELAQVMARDARNLALELRPLELDDVGLESAVQTYVEQWSARYGIAAEVAVRGAATATTLPGVVATALYRITQEALTNVAKHADARRVSVLLEMPDGQVQLIVEDDGRGFDLASTTTRARRERRLGFASMQERAALVAGTLEVESSPGLGTAIYVRVPLDGDAAEQVERA